MSSIELIILGLSSVDLIICLCCRIPQIVRLLRVKESGAISIPYWIMSVVSCLVCITSYGLKIFVLGELSTIIFLVSAILNLIMNFLVLILVLRYRKK